MSIPALLNELINTPSPTGFETRIQRVVKNFVQPYAEETKSDLHGNLIVSTHRKNPRKVMLAGHCDQIGFIVSEITKEGFVYVKKLGGIDAGVVPGSFVVIAGNKGPVRGVFGRKPIHLQKGDEREKMKLDLNNFWIDIGASNKAEAEKLISVGDHATFELKLELLGKDFLTGPGIDDKSGLYVVLEAQRRLAGKKLAFGVEVASTVQEEVGLRGATTSAYSINPEIGIAVDVHFGMDNPGKSDEKGACVSLGKGPVLVRGPGSNDRLFKQLVAVAKRTKLPVQIIAEGRPGGNDSNVMQLNRAGVAATGIGLPCRYMHSQVEMVSAKDLENAIKLIVAFVQSLDTKSSFIPE